MNSWCMVSLMKHHGTVHTFQCSDGFEWGPSPWKLGAPKHFVVETLSAVGIPSVHLPSVLCSGGSTPHFPADTVYMQCTCSVPNEARVQHTDTGLRWY